MIENSEHFARIADLYLFRLQKPVAILMNEESLKKTSAFALPYYVAKLWKPRHLGY